MPLPAGVQTVTVTSGPFLDHQGHPAKGETTFTPTKLVKHLPTGTPLLPKPIKAVWDIDGNLSAELIAVDSAGLDRSDWGYRVTHRATDGGPSPLGKTIQPLASAPVVDLDLMADAATTIGTVVSLPALLSVAGLTGSPTARQLADALDELVVPGGGAGGALSGEYPNPGLNEATVESIVAGKVPGPGPLATALGAAYGRLRPSLWATATGRTDGNPTTADSGQTLSRFGNSPITVTGGLFVHSPAPQANSAGYLQADAGSSVVALGAEVIYPVASTGAVALVAPSASWAASLAPQAGVHFVMYGDGNWHVSNWNGSAEDTYYASGKCSAMQDGQPRRVELLIDRVTSTLMIYLPDGTTVVVADSRIAANTSALAVAELYESNGVGAVPAQIKSWWAQGSADVAVPRNPASATKGDIARAVQQYKPATVAMKQYTPATDPAITVPTSSAEISAGNTEVTFTAPASGKVRLTATGYLTMTAAAKVIWSFLDQNGVTRAGVQVAIDGQQNGPRTVQWLITGLTAGTSYTLRWFHFATVASAAVFHAHGGSGYFADMSVDPVL